MPQHANKRIDYTKICIRTSSTRMPVARTDNLRINATTNQMLIAGASNLQPMTTYAFINKIPFET